MELKEFFILIKFIITKFEKLKVSYCWSTTAVHQYSRLFHCSFPLYLNISGWGVGGWGGGTTHLRIIALPVSCNATSLLVVAFPPPRFIKIHTSNFDYWVLTIDSEYNFFYQMLLLLVLLSSSTYWCCLYISLRGFNLILVPIVPEISGTIFPENFRNDIP